MKTSTSNPAQKECAFSAPEPSATNAKKQESAHNIEFAQVLANSPTSPLRNASTVPSQTVSSAQKMENVSSAEAP